MWIVARRTANCWVPVVCSADYRNVSHYAPLTPNVLVVYWFDYGTVVVESTFGKKGA